MSLRFTKLLFHPDTLAPTAGSSGSNASTGSELGKQDIYDFLNSDDKPEIIDLAEPPAEKETKETKTGKEETPEEITDVKEKDEEEEDGLSAIEKDLEDEEEPDEEKLDLVTPVARREILKKYPNVFKDFPYLEKAYYREQQFTQIHPTIEEARISKDKSDTLDAFEADLMKGNTEKMLMAAKSEPEGFNNLVDNYLTTLAKVDEKAYHHVLGNVIKHTIIQMVSEARTQNNDVLQNAAAILNQFVFGSSKFEPPSPLSTGQPKSNDTAERQLAERERAFNERRYKDASSDVVSRINNSIKSTIEQNMDPKQSMTDYVRRTAIRDANEQVQELIKKDSRFKLVVDKLWEHAKKNDYSRDSIDKVRKAYLSKAKTLLPSVIKKARNEALKGMGKRVTEDREEKTEKSERNERSTRSNTNSGKKPGEGMSTLEFLMSDD